MPGSIGSALSAMPCPERCNSGMRRSWNEVFGGFGAPLHTPTYTYQLGLRRPGVGRANSLIMYGDFDKLEKGDYRIVNGRIMSLERSDGRR